MMEEKEGEEIKEPKGQQHNQKPVLILAKSTHLYVP